VILASRIELMNKELKSQFLISEDVWRELGPEAGDGASVGPVMLKGHDRPLTLFRLA
jgi:adenylate cyclase